MLTQFHAKYFAHELTKRFSSNSLEKFTASLSDAQVDLNPHQVEAALFAFQSPLSKGAVLADEVGLGKTIEAGIVISQKWAERKRKILIIAPANLRKQWNQEIADKFFLPSIILETKSFNEETKKSNFTPFLQTDKIVICSYQFARAKDSYIKSIAWDLVVIDEAHRLRNVYKTSNKIAKAIKEALLHAPKILLTATPLQNSLLELYGLVSIIDEYTFGDLKSFKTQFARLTTEDDFDELKRRLKPVCIRTLRSQVLEYINYTNRTCIVQEFTPSEDEQKLYELVSDYLQRPNLYALPAGQRTLMTLILRKLLASSTYAISGTLQGLADKLEATIQKQETPLIPIAEILSANYETYEEQQDEWIDDEEVETENEERIYKPEEIDEIKQEIKALKEFKTLAKSISINSKGEALFTALAKGFEKLHELKANKKAIIFTESTRTQEYLKDILEARGYKDEIVLFNGSNTDPKSNQIYKTWLEKHHGTDRITGSKTADKRAALVDHFRDTATIMIATEAAAEGINLQFCSLIVNYDLPWNPQRIEQRIGRCHRYGQKFDVVVVNFLNNTNAADQRVYQLLDEKFRLFDGVFGASDEVLGTIESGVDFEKRIVNIYQTCRTTEAIQLAFDFLQQEMESGIVEQIDITRKKLLENFDEEVHEKLRINLKESREYLSKFENWLWQITKYYLEPFASFDKSCNSFHLKKNPFEGERINPGLYRIGKKNIGEVHKTENIDGEANLYRLGHPLAQQIIEKCKADELGEFELIFDYTGSGKKISSLEKFVGQSGYMFGNLLSVTSFEVEDFINLCGVTENETIIDKEVCERFFSLSATVIEQWEEIPIKYMLLLTSLVRSHRLNAIDEIGKRNTSYFEIELEKLDNWGEDRRNSLKVTLKELDEQIKDIKKQARLAPNLPEKLKLEKERRKLETERDEAWKDYDGAAKEIEKNKDQLLDNVEKRLKQDIKEEPILCIKWKLI